MIPAISTDAAGRLNLYFRVNANNVPISLVFKDSAGDPYSFIYDDFQLIIKHHIGAKKNAILLGFGSGLQLTNNVLTFQITQALSKVKPGEYYWELYKNDYGRPWLNGIAYAIEGITPTIDAATTVTVNEGGYSVEVTIIEGVATEHYREINGGAAASVYLLSQRISGGNASSF